MLSNTTFLLYLEVRLFNAFNDTFYQVLVFCQCVTNKVASIFASIKNGLIVLYQIPHQLVEFGFVPPLKIALSKLVYLQVVFQVDPIF